MKRSTTVVIFSLVTLVLGCSQQESSPPPYSPPPPLSGTAYSEWPAYGGDPGGTRYSPLTQINRDNVRGLQVAWTYKTGEAKEHGGADPEMTVACSSCHSGDTKFEATPILADGRLLIGTPLNRVIALDPANGNELWTYDAEIDLDQNFGDGFVSRGVSAWRDETLAAEEICRLRTFLGTMDARLIAIDSETGMLCQEFGSRGTVKLDVGVGRVQKGQYSVTSPPAIVGDVVIVGSSIGDNRLVEMERGTVRGYDARTGMLIWAWDPIPRTPEDPGWDTWTPEAAEKTGGANAWGVLSADPERDAVYIPVGSAAPDFYGGERPGDNLFSDSIVALRASTGEYLWHYQVVHHDLWDYDIAAQPSLVTLNIDGKETDAVVVLTKMGLVFVLDRDTGEPLFEVEERAVPASDVPGEVISPTQPIPIKPPPLHPLGFTADDVWGKTPEDKAVCQGLFDGFRHEGMYTPPSLQGILIYPGYAGGINWGGGAIDQKNKTLVVNILRLAFWVKLSERITPRRGNQRGTPYTMSRAAMVAPSELPCNKPPWGTLVSVDLEAGEIDWEVPLGMYPELAETPEAADWGSLSFGGPIITAGGLVFIAAARDDVIRAFDIDTGEEIWKAELPAGGQATPMTYEVDGRQYLVIAAGGHANLGTTIGDSVVAFALD
ncbi:MAG: glucose/quinate/shikimate family membrane-bound PQQ-dependent dehydrogenase [Rhodothermia bacterium]|nr:MAG: glucose/quinate/shikimate family membrane-bound PQQ-dependent dehydrogenase [Rhodothermia bacterium]